MNIAMEQTEEYVDGQLKSKYGDCFIRGNNGEFVLNLALFRCSLLNHPSDKRWFLQIPQCFTYLVKSDKTIRIPR
jgi:hypothetical protein